MSANPHPLRPSGTGRPARGATALRLGLIGGNIHRSRAPLLHRICGELTGVAVSYDLIIPAERGTDFDAAFVQCLESGMRGVNITYPFKEQVVGRVHVADPRIARVGSINTVVFEPAGPAGHNTDFTGFIAAYRGMFAEQDAGCVALVGAGGVGRAIGFALLELGATELRLVDRDGEKARMLAHALADAAPAGFRVLVAANDDEGFNGADGVVNATPMGMHGYPGSAVPATKLSGRRWAFDAVYTPRETEFVKAAATAGLAVLSGYELFFYQGVQAFELFSGVLPPDLMELRRRLAEADHP